ncbi:MAG: hypothetical protein QOH87_4662, partial [Trebonia sp.]|nr:hypothetical protein [Trebonia sp.]
MPAYFQPGPQGRKVSSIIAFAGARSAVNRLLPGTVTQNPGQVPVEVGERGAQRVLG